MTVDTIFMVWSSTLFNLPSTTLINVTVSLHKSNTESNDAWFGVVDLDVEGDTEAVDLVAETDTLEGGDVNGGETIVTFRSKHKDIASYT